MCDKIIIDVHSIVDVITNSSTELFIINKDKTVELVKDILCSAIQLHNKATGETYVYEDMFLEPVVCDPNQEIYEYGYGDDYKSKFAEAIVIQGATDNSVPYWMFDFIESAFGYDTERIHMG